MVDSECTRSDLVGRQAFLRGMAGVAVAAGSGIRASSGRRPGPASEAGRRASVRVDLSRTTGKTVGPYLYGYATGALLDGDFRLAANGAAGRSAGILAPALIRFNTPVQPIIQAVFAKGVSRPDWAPFSRWVAHRADFLRPGGRLVFGIGPAGGDTSIPPATWAEYAKATAVHFKRTGQQITYWEAGNECDPMGVAAYSRYFNAIADALHSVNPGYLVGGPVASWWNGIDLPAFVSRSGRRIGFIDFHSYPVNDKDSAQAAFHKAATFADVMDARRAVAGTVAARLPIGLLEYNMNGGPQPDGTYGLPAQGNVTGAVYVALLLARAFASDTGFTMGAMWDLVADSNYGAIGNAQDKASFRAIDEQGHYLRQAARLMPGQQVPATTAVPDLQVLATRNDRRFSAQLVNYHPRNTRQVTVSVSGRTPGSRVMRWELSARHPNGHASTIMSLARVSLPPQSIVILNGPKEH